MVKKRIDLSAWPSWSPSGGRRRARVVTRLRSPTEALQQMPSLSVSVVVSAARAAACAGAINRDALVDERGANEEDELVGIVAHGQRDGR